MPVYEAILIKLDENGNEAEIAEREKGIINILMAGNIEEAKNATLIAYGRETNTEKVNRVRVLIRPFI